MKLWAIARWPTGVTNAKSLGQVHEVRSMNDVPTNLGADFFLVRRGGVRRRAVFSCPCGCGRRIDLNLHRNTSPYWTVRIRKQRLSLEPSVWLREDPCRSHFMIRDHKIFWANAGHEDPSEEHGAPNAGDH